MSLTFTDRASDSLKQNEKTLNLVLDIEGVSTPYSSSITQSIIKVGDGYKVGGGQQVGDLGPLTGNEQLVSFAGGTSNQIAQSLNIDTGSAEGVSSFKIALVDKGLKITNLISPGNVVTDILGRKCRVWLGFEDSVYPSDYNIIFRGTVETVEAKAGTVALQLAAPEYKKRGSVFPKGNAELTATLTDAATTATVDASSSFLTPYVPPGGADADLTHAIRINDEIITYTGTTSTSFTGLTRGAFGTTAVEHSSGDAVESFYVIAGNVVDLALKLMMSGVNGPYASDIDVRNFRFIEGVTSVDNAIYLGQLNPEEVYGIRPGDFVTTTGAANGANNITEEVVDSIVASDNGYYLRINGQTFVTEVDSDAVISFRSQYDVWGENAGLQLGGDEVDIQQYLNQQLKFLSSAQLQIYIRDILEDGIEYIAEEILNPFSSFSVPRNSKTSINTHVGPIPGVPVETLNITNVISPDKLNMVRSTSSNFFNAIVYKFDEDALEEDKFTSGLIEVDSDSLVQIPVGQRALVIPSKGLRSALSGLNQAQIAAGRRLSKYAFGAETIKGVKLTLEVGLGLEIGDKIILNMSDLKISDIITGTRSGADRLFDIINKKVDIRKGQVSIDIQDSNFNLSVRYCLVGPASKIDATGATTSSFTVKPSFNQTQYGAAEYKKWTVGVGTEVVVRSPDYSVSDTANILEVSTSNVITLDAALSFTPLEDYIIELGDYDNQTATIKSVYGFMSDGDNNFADGAQPYQFS